MDALWDEVNRELSGRGFLPFPGSLSADGVHATWPLQEGIEGFLELAGTLGVRVIYLRADRLEPGDLIDAVDSFLPDVDVGLDAESPEEYVQLAGVGSEPDVQDYLRQGRSHYGQITSIRVEWVHGGVAHGFQKLAAWYGRLLDGAAGVAELIETVDLDASATGRDTDPREGE
jgi:hypothetical protein